MMRAFSKSGGAAHRRDYIEYFDDKISEPSTTMREATKELVSKVKKAFEEGSSESQKNIETESYA